MAKKKKAAPAKKAQAKPTARKKIDLGDNINNLDWILAHSGTNLGELKDDLEVWLEELQDLLENGDELGIDESTEIDDLKWNGPYYKQEQSRKAKAKK